jgi:hypothetical protein
MFKWKNILLPSRFENGNHIEPGVQGTLKKISKWQVAPYLCLTKETDHSFTSYVLINYTLGEGSTI